MSCASHAEGCYTEMQQFVTGRHNLFWDDRGESLGRETVSVADETSGVGVGNGGLHISQEVVHKGMAQHDARCSTDRHIVSNTMI